MYDVIRIFQRTGTKRVILRNVTELVAQLHCSSKNTSSKTCTSSEGKRRTSRNGPWFDCYRAHKCI